jgi:hypothetical protein
MIRHRVRSVVAETLTANLIDDHRPEVPSYLDIDLERFRRS